MTFQLRLRLMAWYAAAVGSITTLPFVVVVMEELGATPGQAATALFMLPVGQLLSTPAWSWVADRTSAVWTLRFTTAASTLGAILLASAEHFEGMVPGVLILALTRSPVFPIGDALTVKLLGEHRRDYGRIRAVGSVVFAVVSSTRLGMADTMKVLLTTSPSSMAPHLKI